VFEMNMVQYIKNVNCKLILRNDFRRWY